ncbi:MAG: hypothetical protein ACI4JI_03275 [Ruminiclostridium sp.]
MAEELTAVIKGDEAAGTLSDLSEGTADKSEKAQTADNAISAENNRDSGTAQPEKNGDEEKAAQDFKNAVLRLKAKKAERADSVIGLAAKVYGANKDDYDGIESALYERLIAKGRKNDMVYRLKSWRAESEAVKEQYPSFDLKSELSDRRFFSLCYKGVSLADAYLITHKDEIIMAAMEYAAAELTRNGVGRSAADRVREGALSAADAVPGKAKKLSKSERRELIRRTERGERIIL